jgi:HEAT repeat protein
MLFLTPLLFALSVLPPQQNNSGQAQSVDDAWTTLQAGLNSNADKRAKAVRALGLIVRNPKAQTFAEKALTDSSSEVRVEAATALGQMGAKSAQPKLERAIDDTDLKVVVAAANSLYTFKNPAAYEVYFALLTGDRKGPGMVKTQMNMFKDRKQLEKLMFETSVGFVPFGGMGLQAFRTLTRDDTSPVRAVAAERLATDPDPKTSQALEKACSDKQWRIRLAAVEAIAKRGNPSLLKSVRPLLYQDNDEVRFAAAATIIRLSGSPSARTNSSRKGRSTGG